MDQTASFGYWMRRRRKMLDLTQEELARRAGCAMATIRKIEADERRPSRDLAEHLASCLEIPPDERAAFLKTARAELAADRLDMSPGTLAVLPAPANPTIARHYALREQIGAGGFSVVYRAEQLDVGREVAIKIIAPAFANHPAFIRRFESEAQIVARLEHQHIVPLYDFWRESGGAYLVMRYLPGGSLHAALSAEPWPLERCTRLLEQIGAALAFAHRHGVVHRDLKPANILLDADGAAYLADFSIAQSMIAAAEPPGLPLSSPNFLAPEQLAGELAAPQADIYSLGMLLRTLLTGLPPAGHPPLAEPAQAAATAPLAALRPDLPAGLDAVLRRATAPRPAARYPDALAMIADWRRAVAPGSAPPDTDLAFRDAEIENPYCGLRAFGEADAANFFGRTNLVARLLERMADGDEHQAPADSACLVSAGQKPSDAARQLDRSTAAVRFLAVVGPSGSGKSSAVRAGLLPALRRGGLPGSEHWFIIEMQPGAHPLEELEAALLRVAVNPPASLLDQLAADTRGLARAIKRVLPADGKTELLLVIDQLEELWTLTTNEPSRAHFLGSLLDALADPNSRLRVIVTLRADFYDRPLLYGSFGKLVRERTEVVLQLSGAELEQAIVEPAARASVATAPDLVATIVRDIGDHPGALPLLQYTLTDVFEHRDGRALTLAAYRASGGVFGALGGRAEALYAELPPGAQATARQIFLRLVALGEGTEDTRRRVPRSELEALVSDDRTAGVESLTVAGARQSTLDTVLDAYGRARLLTFDRDPITRGPTVEVAHEALLRTWGRLRGWLAAARDDIRTERVLASEAAQWCSAGRDPSYLLSGGRLAHFAEWAERASVTPTQNERMFLNTSLERQSQIAAQEQVRQQQELLIAQRLAETEQRRAEEQRRAAARLRRRAVLLAAALALTLAAVAAVVALAWNNATLARQSAASAATAQAGFVQSERLRLAAEATAALERGSSGELPALLAIHSLHYGYSAQADSALLRALAHGISRQRLAGHTDAVTSIAVSPDGRRALTGSADATARLWDIATGHELRVFSGHAAGVNAVAFAPDGRRALTGSADATARLWDIATGHELRVFSGHADAVSDVAFAPGGTAVLTGSFDRTARLWDIASGHELRVFSGHLGGITSVAFAPDNRTALTGSFDRTARLWDIASGRELRVFSGHLAGITSVAFAPDNKTALTGSLDMTARLWDIASGRELVRLAGHTDAITGVAFASDGRSAATSSADRTARVWDIATGHELRHFIGHADMLTDLAFTPDSTGLVTAGADRIGLEWDARPQTEPRLVAYAAGPISGAALAPDGTLLLAASGGTAELWDLRLGKQLHVLSEQPGITGVAFAPDGTRALTSGAGGVRLWDTASGRELRVLGGGIYFGQAAFAPDRTQVVAADANGRAWLWDTASGHELQRFAGHSGPIINLAFAPNGRYLLTGSADTTARLWEVATGHELRRFTGHLGAVTSVAFAPDSQTVLTGSADGSARLWEIATGHELQRFTGHGDTVTSVAFAPDGQVVLTGSADRTARLWEVATGHELRRLTGHTGAITSVAFAPDGKTVLTGSADKTIRLWQAGEQAVVQLACALLLHDLASDERATYAISDTTPACAVFGGNGS